MKRLKSKGKAVRVAKRKHLTNYYTLKTGNSGQRTELIVDFIEHSPELIYTEIKEGRLKLNKESYKYFLRHLENLRPDLYLKWTSKKIERNLTFIGIREKES